MSENNTTQTEANQVNQPSTEASQNNVHDGMITRKKLMKLFNKHLEKVMPKGTHTITIGIKK